MKREALTTVLLLCGLAACAAPSPRSAVASTSEPTPIDWTARLESTGPGEELESLASLVGDWEVVLEELDGRAAQSRPLAAGHARIRPSLGGRYYAWDAQLELEGHAISAHGRLGFDTSQEVYQFLWISELAPGMRIASGRGDARRAGLVLEIAERDAESGAVQRARSVLAIEDQDRFSLTQLGLDPVSGAWIALQRTRYVRVEPSAAAQEAPRQR